MADAERIEIAVIIGAHGVRGEVKIRPLITLKTPLTALSPLTDITGKTPFTLTQNGLQGSTIIASIKGISDRNAAEKLKKTILYIAPNKLPALPSGAPHLHELVGLDVLLNDETPYGTVTATHNFGAGDIIDIKKLDGSEEMLPLNDNFVVKIDISEGFIKIHPPEYLTMETP